MKLYENTESARKFMPLLPVCARIDGKNFTKYTKGLEKPYDNRISRIMAKTAEYLAAETQACIAYTQSDEINLVWYSGNTKSQIFFD